MLPIGLRSAVRHLTCVPIPYHEHEARPTSPARSLVWFPVVGAALGLVLYAVRAVPMPSLTNAALVLLVWIAITRGLHEDGLQDSADAAFAIASPERRHAILADPHAGSFAIVAAITMCVLRVAAIHEGPHAALLAAPIAGRWTMCITVATIAPAKTSGLGALFAHHAPRITPSIVAMLMLAIVVAVTWSSLPGVLAVGGTGVGILCALWLSRQFGGASGDVHGAAAVVAETSTLVLAASLS